ncbi:MAG TPA: S1/P1 nuclease [Fimbriimonadaceae bacterium]|nr:S1/P1 nuclease [Fimbriimonadaceae bacterium]
MKILACLATLSIAISAFAWHDTGHMVVAEIARQTMNPRIVAECEWLLKIDSEPKTDTFVTAACWADDFKSKESGPWHYINYHFRTDGKETDNKPEPQNILVAIKRFSETLQDKSKDPKERAVALRYLIHFVGDLHQPLHAVARDSDEFPAGDRGGNEFKIIPSDRHKDLTRPPTNLHSLWDMGGNLFRPSERPLTKDGQASIVRIANAIRARHPLLSLNNVTNQDPEAWAQESVGLAKEFVYTLKENEVPSPEYLRRCEDESAKRVAYAGYRLAALLTRLMS